MITDEMRQFMMNQVRENFLRYVKVYTTSDPENETDTPSTERQWDLARMLEQECRDLGMQDVHLSDHCYVYATLPANEAGQGSPVFGLLAHVDASPDQPGDDVKPRRIENYDGGPISYPDDPELTLSQDDSPELKDFIGDTIITASGKTLLSADDKAGVAEIMAGMATFQKYPDLPHGEIKVCFTPDEEIGRGTVKIDEDWLPKFCYTFDGGYPGELEDENFDAWGVNIVIKGVGVHPGYAKDKMINAVAIAARYVAALPEWETPEHTQLREGFIHPVNVKGDFENASAYFIVRDFEEDKNKKRLEYMEALAKTFEMRYPGLEMKLEIKHQYQNMRDIVRKTPEVVDIANEALEAVGLTVLRKAIRGGTDGARLTQLGHPTPNIFAGGLLFHSRKEWVAESSLLKAVEVIVHLGKLWADRK